MSDTKTPKSSPRRTSPPAASEGAGEAKRPRRPAKAPSFPAEGPGEARPRKSRAKAASASAEGPGEASPRKSRVKAASASAESPEAAKRPRSRAKAPSPPEAPAAPAPAPETRGRQRAAASVVAAFAATQRFPLDEFQLDAMRALEAGRSVLVSAPTGSGKTIVAEFAIFLARHRGRRCIYTTPLKALSNQKFRDLRDIMGDDVGLVTGDVVINPEAPVLIMTTEILRNMLQVDPTQVDDVSHVILDEAHYIGADGRGTVWEETIVFLGKDTRIVALSATIPNADELATWVSEVHQPMDVILHEERPVPLEAYVFADKVEPLLDAKGRVRVKAFSKDGWVETPLSSQVAHELAKKKMLPAIFFVFSRLGCEKEAIATIRGGNDLTSADEKRRIREAVERAVAQTPGMLGSNATKGWLERLPSGVAPHHAGLLPPLKLLIEELFQQNLLKVVFATETLAAGINMPARTVVITSLSKRTDEGHRMLAVSEFAQMTGRAGRRGMDTVGYGVVLGSHRYGPHDVAALFQGSPEPLRSRFTLNYNMVINLAHLYEEGQSRRIVEQCFSQFQNNATVRDLRAHRLELQRQLEGREGPCPRFPEHRIADLIPGYLAARKVVDEAAGTLRDLEKNMRGQSDQDAQRVALAAPFDSVVVVQRPGAARPEIGLLVNKYRTKRGVQIGVFLPTGHLMRLSARELVLSTGAVVRGVPRAWRDATEPLSHGQRHRVSFDGERWLEWMAQAGVEDELVLPRRKVPAAMGRAREVLETAEAAWREQTCFECPKVPSCKQADAEAAKLRRQIRAHDVQIEAIRARFWNQFVALRDVLQRGDFMRGRELLPRGVALANLRTSNELVAAEVLASGLLEFLEPDELAAAASLIVAEPVRGRMAWRPLRPSPRVVQLSEEVIGMAQRLYDMQAHLGDDGLPLYVVTDYCGMVQAWAANAGWSHVCEISGIDEGQLVRHLRQAIDMLNQFKDVPGMSPGFQERVMSALAAIDRDIVREVF